MNIDAYHFGKIDIETRQYLHAQGIQVREARTREAVQEFNCLQKTSTRVVGALHLTC